jgi:hypothetical protein
VWQVAQAACHTFAFLHRGQAEPSPPGYPFVSAFQKPPGSPRFAALPQATYGSKRAATRWPRECLGSKQYRPEPGPRSGEQRWALPHKSGKAAVRPTAEQPTCQRKDQSCEASRPEMSRRCSFRLRRKLQRIDRRTIRTCLKTQKPRQFDFPSRYHRFARPAIAGKARNCQRLRRSRTCLKARDE